MEPVELFFRAVDLLDAPEGRHLEACSTAIAGLVPHRALVELSASLPPIRVVGDPETKAAFTPVVLADLLESASAEPLWRGGTTAGGRPYRVSVLRAEPKRGTASVLVLVHDPAVVLDENEELAALQVVSALWRLLATHRAATRRAGRAAPMPMPTEIPNALGTPNTLGTRNALGTPNALGTRDVLGTPNAPGASDDEPYSAKLAAAAGAQVAAELVQRQSALVKAMLVALRSSRYDDRQARSEATGLAMGALLDLRAEEQVRRGLSGEPVGEAFAALVKDLEPVVRRAGVRLEVDEPGDGGDVPLELAGLAAAVSTEVVLLALDRDAVTSLRVGWQVGEELVLRVRDNATSGFDPAGVRALATRIAPVGGTISVEVDHRLGATATLVLPLRRALAAPEEVPDFGLSARELDVLSRVARGLRNREIAREIQLSPATIKFHLVRIFEKLGVGTRGEAAAVAVEFGLVGKAARGQASAMASISTNQSGS
ncbi:response regulator transcription factor [Actinosynnema pretiosum subsp. pretiosum]|uniref:Response regulator transcription factor n=1 Tax=Actinosynnema pretiosum subsp. pretiosum TaxID=103721 RepID=A0AA45R557_9PSEU|nr:transcriptional regulator, LuxR family [Actinosynnema pretiosum subsp. pretiosum]QUF05611.1 response regulator transcription factor [Actinosynnema pretiosum subsp. pretiosum]